MSVSESSNVDAEIDATAFDAFDCVKSPVFLLKVDNNQRLIDSAFSAFAFDVVGFAVEDELARPLSKFMVDVLDCSHMPSMSKKSSAGARSAMSLRGRCVVKNARHGRTWNSYLIITAMLSIS